MSSRIRRSVRWWLTALTVAGLSGSALAAVSPSAGMAAEVAAWESPARAQEARAGTAQWRVAWATAIDGISAPSLWTAHPTWSGTPTEPETSYRFIVRPTVSGGAVRLRFSNPTVSWSGVAMSTGSQPVTFSRVTVGTRDTGANLVTGTNQEVTFAGQRTVTIPPDGSVVSDPIPREVDRLADLAVSVHVPTPTLPPLHAQTYVTQYATTPLTGDHTQDQSGDAYTLLQEPIYWLDGLDVLTSAPRSIVAIGDSITDGDQGPAYTDDIGMDRYPTWPDFLVQRLASTTGIREVGVVNAGINGDNATGVMARLPHDVIEHPGVTDVVVEIGTNDISQGDSAETVIANIESIVATLHQHGLRVIGATLVPRAERQGNTAEQDAAREQVNAFIRNSPSFDGGVLDIAAAVGQPGDDNYFQPRYDSGDGLHPNTAGYQAIADSLSVQLLRS